jgi:hypothetical protein
MRTLKQYSEQDKTQATDHDSLIRLESKVDQILVDIAELKDGTTGKIIDLDRRIKALEEIRTRAIGVTIALGFLLGLFGLYIRGFIEEIYKHLYK